MERRKIFNAIGKTLSKNKVMIKTESDGIYIRLAGNPDANEYFTLEWIRVHSFAELKDTNASIVNTELTTMENNIKAF
jgi:hypothetical protein